jgi:hypothetical protein
MSAREEYLVNADRCFMLADQHARPETKRSLLQARESWLLLARLDETTVIRGANAFAEKRPFAGRRAAVLR